MSLGLLTAAAAAPAGAVTFADYSANITPNINWTQSGDFLSGSLSGSGSTYFSFLTSPLAALVNLPATFTLSATGAGPAQSGLGQLAEQKLSGFIDFSYAGATTLVVGSHTYATGAKLLHVKFSGAELIGPAGGSTASVQDAALSGGSVSFTSDFTGFSSTGDKALSLEMTSILPSFLALPSSSLNSFSGVSTGSFAADLSSGGGVGGTPEPSAWAMMVLGAGAVGAALRMRRDQPVTA
jgi:hypothetical protein